MNALSSIYFQLSEIEKLLARDLRDGIITYNYLICEEESKFLNRFDLQEYLTETQIHNFSALTEINKKCQNIINIWNKDFLGFPDRKFTEPFVYANEETGKSHYSELEFNAVYLTADKWHVYNTRLGKENFVAHYNYLIYTIPAIAGKCASILNMVTHFYPETWTPSLSGVENDVVYIVSDFADKSAKSTKLFTNSERVIAQKGYDSLLYNGERINLYSPEISFIFYNVTIAVIGGEDERQVFIETDSYFKAYYAGYKKGQQFFENHYKASSEIIYGQHSNAYVEDIIYNFNKAEISEMPQYRGWNFVRKFSNITISNKIAQILGFYSGVNKALDSVVSQYPNLFSKLDDEIQTNNSHHLTQSLQLENQTLSVIKPYIESVDKKGWQYSFRDEADYNTFTVLLTAYFEQKEYILPAKTIKLQRGCKTKLAKAFGEILRELGNKDKLNQETGFFEIVRTLNHFQKDDIYKTITR